MPEQDQVYKQTDLTDADISAVEIAKEGSPYSQKAVQAMDVLFLVVDLSGNQTLGKAILDAILADANLRTEFGTSKEREILNRISGIEFQTAAGFDILSYPGATTHKHTYPGGVSHYFPAVRVWRRVVSGAAGSAIRVYYA